MHMRKFTILFVLLMILCSCAGPKGTGQAEAGQSVSEPQTMNPVGQNAAQSGKTVKVPDHVVIVVEENHSRQNIIGNQAAPYMNRLAKQGAYFTESYANAHPSQPNYLILFSGSDQGVHNDSCGHTFTAPNLASELFKHKLTFAGYSEGLPSVGSTVCTNKQYGRKHSPWVNFTNIPKSANRRFTDFPADYTQLPTVSFVIPNLDHDMHDGTIQAADRWLKQNMGPYVEWAKSHNSILILTWDEDDYGSRNHIPTIIVGDHVRQIVFDQKITHLNVLRTMEDLYGLSHLGRTSGSEPIRNLWKPS